MSLKSKIKEKEKRMEELSHLLQDVRHPAFNDRVSERNALSVDIEVLRQQLSGTWNPQYKCATYKLPTNIQVK